MTALSLLGTTLGFAFAAGLNLYATVLVVGLAIRLDWLPLPVHLADLQVLADPVVLGAAAVMYAVEFLADKIPAVDHAWDLVHSVIRPAGAAWIAWRAVGGAGLSEPAEVALLLAAGGVALSAHLGKAGTRLAVGATGGHFLGVGVFLSLLEDLVAFLLAPLSILVPLLVLAFVLVSLVGVGYVIWRMRRRAAAHA
ncbi:MAG: DUF4126 domain-containing protein [Acidobacteria bacterium]|nr:MAG: DUF4126 domain-containing protein [Acidobacteriota bacterium]